VPAMRIQRDEDTYWLKAVGTSFRTEAFEEMFGRRQKGVDEDVTIELVREPDNKYDPNAVKVMCDGYHLGYLSRENAVAYKGYVEDAGGRMPLPARVIGGYVRYDGKEMSFGVRIAAPLEWKGGPVIATDDDGSRPAAVDVDKLFDVV
jgi:HIRAN domain.